GADFVGTPRSPTMRLLNWIACVAFASAIALGCGSSEPVSAEQNEGVMGNVEEAGAAAPGPLPEEVD
ncbi:MAG: hypothetical protein WD716_01175, partial [Fimbriimonadaceae bacterium]